MEERHEHEYRHEHRRRCECKGCCNGLFSCGDRINVAFVSAPDTFATGTYISSSCDRLIWRRDTTGLLECTPCSLVTIQQANNGRTTV